MKQHPATRATFSILLLLCLLFVSVHSYSVYSTGVGSTFDFYSQCVAEETELKKACNYSSVNRQRMHIAINAIRIMLFDHLGNCPLKDSEIENIIAKVCSVSIESGCQYGEQLLEGKYLTDVHYSSSSSSSEMLIGTMGVATLENVEALFTKCKSSGIKLKTACVFGARGVAVQEVRNEMNDYLGSSSYLTTPEIEALVNQACKKKDIVAACTSGYNKLLDRLGFLGNEAEEDSQIAYDALSDYNLLVDELHRQCIEISPVFLKLYRSSHHKFFVDTAMTLSMSMLPRAWVDMQIKFVGTKKKKPEEACREMHEVLQERGQLAKG